MIRQQALAVSFSVVCHVSLIALEPEITQDKEDKKTEEKAPVALSLTIRCDRTELMAGDKVPISFVIRNEGATDYVYYDRSYDRSGRMGEYELLAVDERGKAVPDPRAKLNGGTLGGGVCQKAKLPPDKSFAKTIALNSWALLTKPGDYQVTGVYHAEGGRDAIQSKPIRIKLLPRTDEIMESHIKELSAQLAAATDQIQRAELVRKLMYAGDRRATPALVEAMYQTDAANFWCVEAFRF